MYAVPGERERGVIVDAAIVALGDAQSAAF
jgi:hypothetical protein